MNPLYLRNLKKQLIVIQAGHSDPIPASLDVVIEILDQIIQIEERMSVDSYVPRHGADRHNQFDPQYALANHEH
jgi:hypothetical protein